MTIEKCAIFILFILLPMNVVTFPVLIDCIEQTCYTSQFFAILLSISVACQKYPHIENSYFSP
jgi:hypothetical protein